MRKKRIIAGLLSFILMVTNPMAVLAGTDTAVMSSVSANQVQTISENEPETVSANEPGDVSGNETELVSDNEIGEESGSGPEPGKTSVSENDGPQEENEAESVILEMTEVSGNEVPVSDNQIIVEENLSMDYMEITGKAQADLQNLLDQKDIYALVYLTDSYEVKSEPSRAAQTVITVPSARTVQILGVDVEWKYSREWEEYIPKVWYETQSYEGENLYSGYIEDSYLAYSDELLLQWKEVWFSLFPASISLFATTDSYEDVNKFPISYRSALRELKEKHPNWTFVPMNVKRNWDDCVTEQLGDYSWIYYNQPEKYRAGQINSTWYYASRAGIEYYMDPRNFLTEANIFQFEQNTYNASYHTVDALQAFLDNTFMKGKVPQDPSSRTYAQVIYNSGKSRGLSPFNLAARVIQEQGINGTSAMISGTYEGYEGYYNHYNIGASGKTDAEVLRNGLSYAKHPDRNWNTRTKSLEGGAAFIGNGYILQGQDTLYLQKFDIEHGSSALHQYMQNIMAPYTEGRSMKKMYTNAGSLNSAFVFKIPVFNNMPNEYKFTLNKSKVELVRGTVGKESYTLLVKCNGKTAESGTVTFSSDNELVAAVSQEGVITAVGSGQTIIRATVKYPDMNEAVVLECKVTVLSPLKDISLNIEKQELFWGDNLPDEVAYLDENGVTRYTSELPQQVTLNVSYDPIDTTDDRKVTWSVSDKDVISLEVQGENNESAVITAKQSGMAIVTAKVGKIVRTAEIYVRVPMLQASLRQQELTLYKGQSTQITATYAPYNTTDRVEIAWTSEDNTVVTVENGRIIAKGVGTTKLHAAIGPFDGIQEELTVDVTIDACEVTFLNPDGITILTATGEYGKSLHNLVAEDEAQIPWTPEKEDYYFIGWYTEEDGEGRLVTQNTVLYDDMVLYPYFVSKELSQPYVKPVGNMTYTGAYIKPDVKVYNAGEQLKKGVDYDLSYKNNKDINDGSDPDNIPTILISGKGQYVDWETIQTFKIVPKNISHTDIIVKDLSVDYTGKVQKLRPAVLDGTRALRYGKDYTLEYPDEESDAYKEAGTYAVKITGINNYTGERTVYITITRRVRMEDVNISVASEVKYNNGNPYTTEEEIEACTPLVSVKYNGNTLAENTDYILSYENNTAIGTASVTVEGMGTYIGTRTVSYKIVGTKMSTMSVSGIADKEYTGETISQDAIVVKDKNKSTLREGLDYQISYKNNRIPGKASVFLKGIHGYSGEIIKTFTIMPYDITGNTLVYEVESGNGTVEKPAFEVALLEEEVEYEKAGAKPEVNVTFKGAVLKEGTDYKIAYENNHMVSSQNADGPATVVLTGKGLFKGSITRDFTITAKDIAKVDIAAKNVKFRNRKGFCFVEPVLKDESGRRLKAGTDYESELIYTYAEDVVLYDKTIRRKGETVLETDIPTPGELKDAKITVTAKGIGNYCGEVSATYAILENSTWMEELFGETDAVELKINRSVLYLNPLYPELADSIKLGVADGVLLTSKTTVTYKSSDENVQPRLEDLFNVVLEEGKLTLKLNKSREELMDILPDGDYVFEIAPVVELEGKEVSLEKRMVTVQINRKVPVVTLQQKGTIDLLFREKTAVEISLQLSSDVDSLVMPKSQNELTTSYYLSGEDARNYKLVYEGSTFSDAYNATLQLQAVEDSWFDGNTDTGSEQLAPGEESDLVFRFVTAMGVELEQKLSVTPVQSEYEVVPYTASCYVKKETGKGQIVFTSTQPVVYNKVSCNNENVTVSVSGRTLAFSVENIVDYSDEECIPLTVTIYAKGAGKGTLPETFDITLLICEQTELEKLIAEKDTTEKTLEERQKEKTSYEETRDINSYDKKVIVASTVDFSDVSIAFLGDSITEGVGLEKIGIEENVYTTVVRRALNPKAVYQFGYGGKSISRYWDSLLNYYEQIPSDTDYIFVLAGINDVYSGNANNFGSLTDLTASRTFCGDTYELMSSLQNRYPQAKIIFMTPLSTVTNESYKSFLPDMLPMVQYVSAIKAIAAREELTRVEVWDLYNSNLLDSYDEDVLKEYMRDGVHPGVAGHRVPGEHIASELIRMRMEEK